MSFKNKITEDVCLNAGERFVQANIILSIMRGDNRYFATNQSKVNIFQFFGKHSLFLPLGYDSLFD